MNSKYDYPNVFMSIDDTNKVSQYDTDIKKYAEQKKADWILNGGIDEEWDSYLKKMEKYGLSDYLSIKQKYFDSATVMEIFGKSFNVTTVSAL